MKKLLAVLAVIFVICAASAAFAAEPIKIGYLAALTGDYAQYGITEVNMAKMVVGDVNKAGGVLGRPIQLVIYDTKTRNEDAVNAVRRMIEQVFGWVKTTANFRRSRLRGLLKTSLAATLVGAAYNLMRVARLTSIAA